ncbi:uncharacterized protein M421DRAFT_448 [Didymella exigua CBS 183.55]|uniref:Thioesterase domain-containing protein n=1 Tax=Didymella exigua CBS 183.55 TaxID=1150837 RepID=A0A6A5S311_9PLEO|nr:uncharacterized protein M421DRAFT_448 [Didymella exigua CBS 183.55]KAF1934313.1 hypothetical protein M421DRAFT_448 [Didymella exigua CBS 183.55]
MEDHYRRVYAKHGDISPEEKAYKWFEVAKSGGYVGFDDMLPRFLKLESVTIKPTAKNPHNSRVVYSFTVPMELCNMMGSMHGGAVALVFDICTTTAISAIAYDGFWDTGHVSRNLSCTYLRPAPLGTKVYVISEVVSLGRRQGLVKGEIRLETEDGKVAYTCNHDKAAVGASSL